VWVEEGGKEDSGHTFKVLRRKDKNWISVGEVPEEAHEAECMRACVFVAAPPAEGDYHRAEDHTQCGYQMRGQQDP